MQPPPSEPAPAARPPWSAVRALKTLAAFLGAQLAVAGGVGLWVGLRRAPGGAYAAGGGITLNPGLAIGAAVGVHAGKDHRDSAENSQRGEQEAGVGDAGVCDALRETSFAGQHPARK